MVAEPKPFNPAHPPRREGKLHRLAPRLAQKPGPLKAVIDQARQLDRLSRRLQRALPEELQGQWRLARLDEGEMVIVAESSAWATRLRYLTPQIQAAAERVTGFRPQRVTVRVAPSEPSPRRRHSPAPLSEQARATLQGAAAATDDPRLREALERLASRARRAD